ncbi:hypothetical protein Lser_V15G02740 [Lactuca serriola]
MARIVMMVLCVVVTCRVVAKTYAQSITCDQVVMGLTHSIALQNSASARQTACNCLKSFYSSNSGINLSNAASLPSDCGVNLPYKISPSTDCSTVE